jgi:hypothetical protein
MRNNQLQFIDMVIEPIPVFGAMLADLFYTWSSFADAMNLRRLADATVAPPPGDNVVRLAVQANSQMIRKAA